MRRKIKSGIIYSTILKPGQRATDKRYKDGVDTGRFGLFWIKTDDELAGIGTKQTPGPKHNILTNTLLVQVSDGIKSAKAAFAKLIRNKRGDSV